MTAQLSLEQVVACGVEKSIAIEILPTFNQCLADGSPSNNWQHLTQTILTPDLPFALHELLYKTVFSNWDASQGVPPAWFPTEAQIQATHIAALLHELGLQSYTEFHAWTARHRAQFWELMVQRLGIRFRQPYRAVLDLANGIESPQWLLDAQFNIVESCFQAPAEAPAIVFQAEGESLLTLTYGELRTLTDRVANGLIELGFCPGDAIAIDLPMTAESVALYLGIVEAGCTVVSIADSFAADAIATRLRISAAKGIFTQDTILRAGKELPLYAKVIEANAPQAIVLSSGVSSSIPLRAGDLAWEAFLSDRDRFDAIPAQPDDRTNILFSSGTTGEPKAIPWTQTTPIKCAADGFLHHDIHPGDRVAWPTNLGWMMGPWLIYASLIDRATIALYYGAPTGRAFGQFVQDAGVSMLGVVPSLVKSWKTSGCMQGLDWSAIKVFSSTGECSNPQEMLFLMSLAGYRPIVEYCGGTEIGGGYLTGTLVQPCAPSTFTTPALGLDIAVLNEAGQPATAGEAYIVPPSIGLSTELLNRNHHQVYFDRPPHLPNSTIPLRRHGDRVERLPNGYYRALGRVDDTMNLGGIKVSSAEIERVLNAEAGICETAAIAVSPPEGGPSQLAIYAVLEPDSDRDRDDLAAALQSAIRQHLNPMFKIRDLRIVDELPRTASNKVMRRVLRDRFRCLQADRFEPARIAIETRT
ncbi:AMP-binding protein [Synechococcus sp. PCC 7336]|uniref:AMP-binding protein n=1 Tax=Synechococcus sp. PCC 7336 TaxID=195250 RepID=UPI00034B9BF6|nr:AMP-binding protein [Synechococcus sp. PCC 7336]